MYYHIYIETTEKTGKSNTKESYFALNKNLQELEEDIIVPYLEKREFRINGYLLNPSNTASNITRFLVKESQKTTKEYAEYENSKPMDGFFIYTKESDTLHYPDYMNDITNQVIKVANEKIASEKEI